MIKEKYIAIKLLLVLMVLPSLIIAAAGCGGGGGGSVSSQAVPGGGTIPAAGPSITLEGEIDPASLGLDLSSISQAPSRAGADGASRFAVVAVENKAYKTLRKKLLKSPSDKANYAPARGAENFDALLNSGAVISSGTGSLNFNAGKFSYKLNIPITNSSPNGTLMFVDKTNGFPFGSAPIGTLPSINDQMFGNTGSGTGSTTTPASGGGAALNITIDPYMGGVIIRGFGAGTIADNNSSAIKITSSVFGSKITIANGGGVSVAYSGTGNYTVVNAGVYLEMTIDRAGAGSTITNNSSFPLKIGSAEGNLTIAGTGNVIVNNAANTNISNTPKVNNIKVGGFNINNTTTAQGFFNIENDICSNINFINSNSIIKNNNLTGPGSLNGTITLDSSDGNYLNTGAINKVINNNVGANNLIWFGEALKTVNHSLITPKLPDTTKNSIYSNFITTEDMLSGTLNGFVYCVSDSSISNINSSFPSSININGNIIDSRSGQYLLDSVISGTKSTNTDTRIPELSSVIASPASAVTGEAVNLSFRSNVELADIPGVFICGRKANVLKTSSFDYAAWVLLSPSDSVFTFYIDSIIGVNGKQGAAVSATTDGSSVRIMQTAVEVPAPVAIPPAGVYEGSVTVELSTQTPGAIIYYTEDAQLQPIYGTKYSAPIVIENFMSLPLNSTIRAVAVLDGKASAPIRADYKVMPKRITAAAPFFSVPGGRYNRGITVEIYSPTYGAQFRYTLDGSQPSRTNGTLYTASLNISKSVTLKAISFGDGMDDSKIVSAIYEFGEETLAPVAAPVITPESGLYKGPQAVSISCATAGASIRYTLDGSKPSFSAGNLYSSSFVVTKTSQVRAIAFKTGMADSDIASSSIEITGEAEIKPPVTGIAEIEPKRDGTQVNSDFNIALAAPSGAIVTATLGPANALAGVTRVVASGGLAVLPVGVSGLAEGVTSEIKIKAVNAAGETVGELVVAVKKDTVAPRREKMSVASSNPGGASIAELGDRIVISFSTDEPVKNVVATMMGKPVTIRNTDDRNWTVSRYLDGSEFAVDFDFTINFTDLAGNSIAAPLSKKDINEGAPLVINKGGAGGSAFSIYLKEGSGRLYLSAVPSGMEYCLNGGPNGASETWYSGVDAEIDLSGVKHGNFIYVRQKGDNSTAVNLGVIFRAPVYGMDEANTPGRWAFDAVSGAINISAPFGAEDGELVASLDARTLAMHVYAGAGASSAGVKIAEGFFEHINLFTGGRFQIPSHARSVWSGGEYISYYISSNNQTPEFTGDDIYIMPAAGAAVKSAPLNSSAAVKGNYVYDGRSNALIFNNADEFLNGVSVAAALNSGEAELLAASGPAGAAPPSGWLSAVSYKLPWRPAAGDLISIYFIYKDGSVSPSSKVSVYGAPENSASGFGSFSVKALLGQVAVTNFDGARDGFTAFISADDGASWKELGKVSTSVGQNFDVTMSVSSKIKVAMRDKNGNFSLTQAAGVTPMAAPPNSETGNGAYKILGHLKKIEIDNSSGVLNGFNVLYSTDGGRSWSSTVAVNETGASRLAMSEYVRSGDGVRIALLDWKTGNASFATSDYFLKSANNRSINAAAGDFTVNAASKKVSVNNAASALNGYKVFINGAETGTIGAGDNVFAYEPGSSDEVEVYYAEPSGNTWLAAVSKPVAKPRNDKLADGDFFVDALNGKVTFKNSGGAVSGLTPLISTDGGLVWKDIGPALTAGDKEFAFSFKPGDMVAAVFMDGEGNTGAASEVYNASGPKLNAPVKMLLAGDGGMGAKAGLIVESGKPAVKIRPGVALKNGESLKVTLYNGGSVTMTAKASVDGVVPVFGESTPGVIYEAGAAGNGNAATGSFNLNNPGGTPVSIIGAIEVAAVHSDILGNVSPVSKVYITADQTPPSWASGYPSLLAPAYFKLRAGVQTNEDGRIYLVCLKSTEAAPNAAQIKLGQNASGAAVAAGMKAALDFTVEGGAITHEFAGLANNTEYAVHAVAEDGYENLQAQPAVVKMKTLNNVAPIWASGYPAVSAPEFNKLKAAFRMNETGSVYLACLKSGLASLTAAQVKAGTDASGAPLNSAMKAVIAMGTADSESVHVFAGLESAVEYDIYAVAADEYGETQANPTIVKMKTIDDLPPVWSSGYPQGQPTGYTSLRLGASADKKSLVYAVCLASNAPEPTVAQVMAGKNASDIELASNLRGTVEIAANAAGYINFTNLGVGAAYDIYSVAVNEFGIAQAAVTKTRANTIALIPPSVSSAETSADGTKILVKFNKTISSTLPAAPGGFTVSFKSPAGSAKNDVVSGIALNGTDKSVIELTLADVIYSSYTQVLVSYSAGATPVKCTEGLVLANFSEKSAVNKSTVASAYNLFVSALPSNTQVAGAVFDAAVKVSVRDNFNEVVASDTRNITVSVNAGNGDDSKFYGTKTVAAVAGVATFSDLKHEKAETIKLKFTDGTINVVSNNIVIDHAAAASMAITQQPSATATSGYAIAAQPKVKVTDAYGNPVDGVTITAGSPNAADTFSNTAVSAADGVASFSGLGFKNKGSQTLTFTGAGAAQVSNDVSVTLGNVSNFTTVAGNAQVTLNWTNPTNNSFTDIKISYTGPTSGNTTVGNNTSTSKTITGLTNNSSYTFTISTTDGVDDSAALSKTVMPTDGSVFSGNAVELIKNATIVGSDLRLTDSVGGQNGVAMFKDSIDVTKDFTVDYTFDIGGAMIGGGADGITFIVTSHTPAQMAGYNSSGVLTSSGALGGWFTSYINNCFYVEFDTYKNTEPIDPLADDTQAHSLSIKYPDNQSHTPLGSQPLWAQYMIKRAVWNPANTTSEFNGTHNVRISYTASSGEWKIYYDDMATAKITYTYKLSTSGISLIDGKSLYVGVAATTGGSYATHKLTSLNITTAP